MFKGSAAPSSYTINDLGGMALWLDAANYNESTGVWLDKGGKFNHALADGAGKPVLVSNQLNGQPIVRFNSTEITRLTYNGINLALSGCALYIIHKRTVASGAAVITTVSQGGTRSFNGGGNNNNTSFSSNSAGVQDFGIPTSSPYTLALNTFGLAEGHTTTTTAIVGINGQFGTETSHTTTNFTIDRIAQRAELTGSGSHYDGDIAEIIVFTKVQSSAERAIVINYLNNKYAQSWP